MAELREVRVQLRSQLILRWLDVIETAIESGSEVLIALLHQLRPLPLNQPDMAFRWLDSFEQRLRVLEGKPPLSPLSGMPSDQVGIEFDAARDCGKAFGKGLCRMPKGHDGPHMNMWRSEPQDEPGNTGSGLS